MIKFVEYVWLDGCYPVPSLRSKTLVILSHEDPPEWGFDGSSTGQATTKNSDVKLVPVKVVEDPIRRFPHQIALCETVNFKDDSVVTPNTRSVLVEKYKKVKEDFDPWVGFEQEYTLFDPQTNLPLGWTTVDGPGEQGPFYCGVGTDKVFGRDLVENHLEACFYMDLEVTGINAEVMPGQWEFQLGYRKDASKANPVEISDQLWLARYMLLRLAEKYNYVVSFSNKPMHGPWNGAGCHTNFSTKYTRDPQCGLKNIYEACEKLKVNHKKHIQHYGVGLEDRLTGNYETCSINEFKVGESDRGASIRIPAQVANRGYGYFEDRRPGANCDPYLVNSVLLDTICVKEPIAVND